VVFHTAGRLGWVVFGLSLGLTLLVIGLVNTAEKLENYKMNDILWRYFKATNDHQNLQYLLGIENLYLSDPRKMQSFIEKEELRLNQLQEQNMKSVEDGKAGLNKPTDSNVRSIKRKRLKQTSYR
jgi:hypothetical protein